MIFNDCTLSELQITKYANYQTQFLATDFENCCFNKKHFHSFPYQVDYHFNSLGYREYPIEKYQSDCIIVVGDSAVMGIGLPFELTLAKQIENFCNHQVLNFSMCGASNDWIHRKLKIILKYFQPKAVIIHYTFSHRREHSNHTWTDDERTLCDPFHSSDEKYQNWLDNHQQINMMLEKIPACYSFIPNWHDKPISYNNFLEPIKVIDKARDYFHYGPKTTRLLAKMIHSKLTTLLVS